MSSSTAVLSGVFLIIVVALLIAFGPIFTILALNTLFNLSIPVTFWTWLSTVWISFVLFPKSYSKD